MRQAGPGSLQAGPGSLQQIGQPTGTTQAPKLPNVTKTLFIFQERKKEKQHEQYHIPEGGIGKAGLY